MKYLIILYWCLLLICCNGNNNQKKITEYHDFSKIVLHDRSINDVNFEFIYNGDNYKLLFFGKDIASININKNFELDENIPPLLLDFENNIEQFIINELNNSPIINTMDNKISKIINSLIISYDLHLENDVQRLYISVIPTDELINYLIELLEIYYLPLYVVQNGETLNSICLKIYGDTNYEKIIKYNHGMKLQNQYLVVRPNEKIRIKK
jgi:hypothetical protein